MKILEMEMSFTQNYQTKVVNGRLGGGTFTGKMQIGRCFVQAFNEHDSEMSAPRTFFVVTDLGDGPKILDSVADLLSDLYIVFNPVIDFDQYSMVLIIHVPAEKSGQPDKFYLGHAPWNGEMFVESASEEITREEVEELIGGQLD